MAVSLDPTVFPDAARFDPLRFYRLRTAPGADPSAHQFATVSEDALNFGWGRHACPGRFFAANEIKMVVAAVLLEWDVKMSEVEEGEREKVEAEREWEGRRWRNWEYGNFVSFAVSLIFSLVLACLEAGWLTTIVCSASRSRPGSFCSEGSRRRMVLK